MLRLPLHWWRLTPLWAFALLVVSPQVRVAFGAEIEVLAETNPLVTSKPLKAEVAARWVYLQGAFSERTITGEPLLGYILEISITNTSGQVLTTSVVDSKSVGYAFDTMIAQDLDAAQIAKVIVKVAAIDTPELRVKAREQEAARARAEEAARQAFEARAKAERLKAETEATEKRRAAILAKKWPQEIERAVLERRILIGMTTEQVQMSWGRPESINETIRASGTSEQWRYGARQLLYFERGILTTIQRSR